MSLQVAAFTDTYLPTVNGVTYTIKSWRDRWNRAGGRMDVVYPDSEGHTPAATEHPVKSVRFPWYDGYRVGAPSVPDAVADAEVIHAHTAYSLGLGGLRLARKTDTPLVASYHTPASAYTDYLAPTAGLADRMEGLAERYERWFFDRTDLVIAPSTSTRAYLVDDIGVETPVEVVSNGIDTEQFRPVDAAGFRERHDLTDGPLVGYTGRHGYEKRLQDLLAAADGTDWTVVLGGDGPAREELEAQAADVDADVRFLGFLDREEMPAFYSALDVFAFPSPVETEGLVAMEANACGTPVVGADRGALTDTVREGVTGHRFPPEDVTALRECIERTLAERERLSENCLDRRDRVSIDNAVDRIGELYADLV